MYNDHTFKVPETAFKKMVFKTLYSEHALSLARPKGELIITKYRAQRQTFQQKKPITHCLKPKVKG